MKLSGIDFMAALHRTMMDRVRRGTLSMYVGTTRPPAVYHVLFVEHSDSKLHWEYDMMSCYCVDDACERIRRNLA